MGIWNERGYTTDYIDILRQTLDGYGFPDTNIVAHDAGWDIAQDILNNATIAKAVDVIGVHVSGACGCGASVCVCACVPVRLSLGRA